MIELVKQTDPGLPRVFHRYGCRYMCLYGIPQIVTGKALAVKDILEDYEEVKARPDVFKDADQLHLGTREGAVIDAGFRRLSLPFSGAQLGVITGDKTIRWGWAADAERYKAAFIIAHWRTDGADGHYTLFDLEGHELYDPHDPDQADGYVINKRWIQRKLLYGYWEA